MVITVVAGASCAIAARLIAGKPRRYALIGIIIAFRVRLRAFRRAAHSVGAAIIADGITVSVVSVVAVRRAAFRVGVAFLRGFAITVLVVAIVGRHER